MNTFLATTASVHPLVWVLAILLWLVFAMWTAYLAPSHRSEDKAHKAAEAAIYVMLGLSLPVIILGISYHI